MQDIALLDARRGCTMFRKVDVPILGAGQLGWGCTPSQAWLHAGSYRTASGHDKVWHECFVRCDTTS